MLIMMYVLLMLMYILSVVVAPEHADDVVVAVDPAPASAAGMLVAAYLDVATLVIGGGDSGTTDVSAAVAVCRC